MSNADQIKMLRELADKLEAEDKKEPELTPMEELAKQLVNMVEEAKKKYVEPQQVPLAPYPYCPHCYPYGLQPYWWQSPFITYTTDGTIVNGGITGYTEWKF